MMWLLPIIVIGGLFFPALGYLVVGFAALFLPLSFFKGRYWCSHLCPRGAFLDIVMSRASIGKPFPKQFTKMWFRWLIFIILMGFLVYRVSKTGGNVVKLGTVFVSMCLLTTIISIIIAIITKHRGWCLICPMGMLQEKISKIKNKK